MSIFTTPGAVQAPGVVVVNRYYEGFRGNKFIVTELLRLFECSNDVGGCYISNDNNCHIMKSSIVIVVEEG